VSALDDRLTAAIAAQADEQVASLLRGVPEKERRASSKPIQDQVKSSWDFAGEHSALAIAALGLAQSAAQAAEAVRHVDVSKVAPVACEVLAERRPRWLEDFSRRILLPGWALNGGWRLTRALIRGGHVPKPDMSEYITFLPHALGGTFGNDPPLYQALMDDPALMDDEIFRLFTVEGAGRSLAVVDGYIEDVRHVPLGPPPMSKAERSPRTWRVTLKRLCDEGHVDRGRLLDACLSAFLSDFPPSQLIWYAGFHAELAPGRDETIKRSATYLRLLAADAGSVVGLAQRALAPLATVGLLDAAEFIGASRPVLSRAEKKYVLAQLRLLETITGDNPELGPQACHAAALALTHPRADVAEEALRFIGRRVDRLDAAARQQIAVAARQMPPSLRAPAQKILGLSAHQPGIPVPALAGSAAVYASGLRQVPGLHELAETAAALMESPWEPPLVEQLLDGLAGFCGDYDLFAAALAPVAARVLRHDGVPQLRTLSWLLHPDQPAAQRRDNFRRGYAVRLEPFWDNRRPTGTSPGGLLGARLHEIYSRFWRGEPARLLAFPDAVTGHVDPDRVVAELARLETEGRQPWPADFLQALLRLPRQSESKTREAAARLHSPAGHQLAIVLDGGGIPDPRPTICWAGTKSTVTLTITPEGALWGEHVKRIWELPDPTVTLGDAWYHETAQLGVWAWALPSHRDVAVAHALPILTSIVNPWRIRGPIAEFISALPDLDGPVGPATNLALCFALAAQHPENRAAGAEALVGFAPIGCLDTQALGETLATLSGDGSLMLGRICDGLRVAADSGAHALVWDTARAALPVLLASQARHTHRLLAVAADSAARLGARDAVQGLDAISAASGSSRLVVEARRLKTVLSLNALDTADLAADGIRHPVPRAAPDAGDCDQEPGHK
jgi:hypothetical protein